MRDIYEKTEIIEGDRYEFFKKNLNYLSKDHYEE
jgi:hypothetical protein